MLRVVGPPQRVPQARYLEEDLLRADGVSVRVKGPILLDVVLCHLLGEHVRADHRHALAVAVHVDRAHERVVFGAQFADLGRIPFLAHDRCRVLIVGYRGQLRAITFHRVAQDRQERLGVAGDGVHGERASVAKIGDGRRGVGIGRGIRRGAGNGIVVATTGQGKCACHRESHDK